MILTNAKVVDAMRKSASAACRRPTFPERLQTACDAIEPPDIRGTLYVRILNDAREYAANNPGMKYSNSADESEEALLRPYLASLVNRMRADWLKRQGLENCKPTPESAVRDFFKDGYIATLNPFVTFMSALNMKYKLFNVQGWQRLTVFSKILLRQKGKDKEKESWIALYPRDTDALAVYVLIRSCCPAKISYNEESKNLLEDTQERYATILKQAFREMPQAPARHITKDTAGVTGQVRDDIDRCFRQRDKRTVDERVAEYIRSHVEYFYEKRHRTMITQTLILTAGLLNPQVKNSEKITTDSSLDDDELIVLNSLLKEAWEPFFMFRESDDDTLAGLFDAYANPEYSETTSVMLESLQLAVRDALPEMVAYNEYAKGIVAAFNPFDLPCRMLTMNIHTGGIPYSSLRAIIMVLAIETIYTRFAAPENMGKWLTVGDIEDQLDNVLTSCGFAPMYTLSDSLEIAPFDFYLYHAMEAVAETATAEKKHQRVAELQNE